MCTAFLVCHKKCVLSTVNGMVHRIEFLHKSNFVFFRCFIADVGLYSRPLLFDSKDQSTYTLQIIGKVLYCFTVLSVLCISKRSEPP